MIIRSQERRSWARITTLGDATDRFIGKCAPCVLPVAVELPDADSDTMSVTVDCRQCGDAVTLSRIYGTVTRDDCDGTCMGATGRLCGCGCGGKNHGKWFGSTTTHGEVTADYVAAVERYRTTTAKRAATTQARRARKEESRLEALAAAIEAFHADHAEILDAMYECREGDSILSDMLARFEREGALSPRTLAYAESLVKRVRGAREREAREAAKIADRAARGVALHHVGNVGDKITVEGVVTVTYRSESDFGPKMMIIIEGTGAHEGVTVKWGGTAAAIWTLGRGDHVTITGKVKGHSEYNGTPQTVLTYCKVTVHDSESVTETAEPAPLQVSTPPASESTSPAVSERPVTASGRPVPKSATADPSRFPAVALRDGETIQAVFLPGPHGPRRCGDGHGSARSACGKEVVQIYARLSNDFHYEVWRHADGSAWHDGGARWYDCAPVWQCSECGSEDTRHCPKCHADGARVYTQEAWGDRHTCTACDRNDFYSIGD